MEELKYTIDDSTIVELLGVQNFTNEETAVLELVKNAYDAKANNLELHFEGNKLSIHDDGEGMSADDIRMNWMYVGKSDKQYDIIDENDNKRILAGSKGIGRFALSRLGGTVGIYSKKKDCTAIIWKTDWTTSTLEEDADNNEIGTNIIIGNLRQRWTKKKATDLVEYLSRTYNSSLMAITVDFEGLKMVVPPYFDTPVLGKNCLSIIKLYYNSENCTLYTEIESDEFQKAAKGYCNGFDISSERKSNLILYEIKTAQDFELNENELNCALRKVGSFRAEFYFKNQPTSKDKEDFLYKYGRLPGGMKSGIILYRNAFSIASFEGEKDWLRLGMRSRKSPASPSHPTGSWRVRENQISGKVHIDKKDNAELRDMSNRQGLEENIYYLLFVEIIIIGIKEFERYRQNLIRMINKKNISDAKKEVTPVSDKVASNPKQAQKLTDKEAEQLASEIKAFKKGEKNARKEKEDAESRYKYDVRILNVLATVGLKASSVAHEMRNDRNAISDNITHIINALKEYGMWEELLLPEHTEKAYKNVPSLLEANSRISKKLVVFMDTMLSEVEKKKFAPEEQNIYDLIKKKTDQWKQDYALIQVILNIDRNLVFHIADDILQVILDNLILNSIQQNQKREQITINISVLKTSGLLSFKYSDNGKGLDKKYSADPRKILEVHETTRPNGHGLGMWIVNNTVVMSGGEITDINGEDGFIIEFTVGGRS